MPTLGLEIHFAVYKTECVYEGTTLAIHICVVNDVLLAGVVRKLIRYSLKFVNAALERQNFLTEE